METRRVLLGFADAELQDCGASWFGIERSYRERWLAEVQHQLGEEFERHYDLGRSRDRSDLIGFALG